MRGPMGKPKNRVENPGKLLKRLMDYIFRDYKFHCIIVFILILWELLQMFREQCSQEI